MSDVSWLICASHVPIVLMEISGGCYEIIDF